MNESPKCGERCRVKSIVSIVSIALLFGMLAPSNSRADRALQGVDQLQEASDVVLLGVVESLELAKGPAYLERGWGNSDWLITVTLQVEQVIKGPRDLAAHKQAVHCFRVRKRRSVIEFMTPTGVRPVPEPGSRVRVFLYQDGDLLRVHYPNGFQPASEEERLIESAEIAALPAPTFTFLVSMEAWGVLGLVGAIYGGWRWWSKPSSFVMNACKDDRRAS